MTYIAYEGEGRDGYRDQIATCDVGVSQHSKLHPLFMKYTNGTSTVSYIPVSELVSCAFSTILICPFLILKCFIYLYNNIRRVPSTLCMCALWANVKLGN